MEKEEKNDSIEKLTSTLDDNEIQQCPTTEDIVINKLRWCCYDLDLDFNTIRLKYFGYRVNGWMTDKPLSVGGAYLKTLLFMQGCIDRNKMA